jgi:hypothetical protein
MTVAVFVGIFRRGDKPLRRPQPCEICGTPIGVPYWFWTPPVSEQKPARYRCDGCRHAPQHEGDA